MSSPTPPREPTMEEILSSIRRIIAEEGQNAQGSAETDRRTPADPATSSEAEPTQQTAQGGSDDVLDLTDLVDEGAAPDDSQPLELELTDEVTDEEIEELDKVDRGEEVIAAPGTETQGLSALASESLEDVPPLPSAPPLPSELAPAAEGGSLLSTGTEEVAGAALREIAQTIRGERQSQEKLPSPLEAMVREALAPALQAWLDRNLPDLVERVVREEVRRLARRVEEE